MRKALRRILIPVLKDLGFVGQRSAFRRVREDTIDLLEIQYWKYGGEYILEFIRRPRGPLVSRWMTVAEDDLTLGYTAPHLRGRLKERRYVSEGYHGGFVFRAFGENLPQYESLAGYTVSLLDQVESWLENGTVGPNISSLSHLGT